MDDIVPKLGIALVTASVGFFWLLAYKHPRTFKAVATPFAFFKAVSSALEKERSLTAKSEADAKEKKSKEESIPDGT